MPNLPLLGLSALLANPACSAVELARPDGTTASTYVRSDDGTWRRPDVEGDAIPSDDLLEAVRRALDEDCNRVLCRVGAEAVVYTVHGGSVSVQRRTDNRLARTVATSDGGLEAVADALGIPGSNRKDKFRQAVLLGRIVEQAWDGPAGGRIRLLDLACGRSYLGFVLAQLLASAGHGVMLHGVDCQEKLVARCREISHALGWQNARFDTADLARYSVPAGAFDVAVALHACDTLTDDAMRVAVSGGVPLIFLAPCCHHEMRHHWRDHPLRWTARYGLIEHHIAEDLTDAFRCLVLEAVGYRVNVLRFADPELTPKNRLIQAKLGAEPRPQRAAEARDFMRTFGVHPRAAELLPPEP